MPLPILRKSLPLALVLAAAALSAACSSDEPSPRTAEVAILAFEVDPGELEAAGEVEVRWRTAAAASVELLQGDREVDLEGRSAAEGSIVLHVEEDTTFTLTARGSKGDSVTVSGTVTVAPLDAPTIAELTAPEVVQADEAGEALAAIAWAGVERARELRLLVPGREPIELDPGASEGSLDLLLTEDTTVELLATNEAGEASRAAAVRVVYLPAIVTFDARRPLVGFGEASVVRWSTTEAVHVELWHDGLQVEGELLQEGERELLFSSTSTVELRAFNELETMVSATLEVEVGAPRIEGFQVSSDSLWLGEETTLSWQALGGSSLRISVDDSDVTVCEVADAALLDASSCSWTPASAGIFPLTLSVFNSSGVASLAATVFAADGPMIVLFEATPTVLNAGDDLTISWSVHGDPAGNPPVLRLTDSRDNSYDAQGAEGFLTTALFEPGVYQLHLEATTDHPSSAPALAIVELLVHPIPEVDFTASPEHFDDSEDEEVVLGWTTSGAATVELYRLVDGAPSLLLDAPAGQIGSGSFRVAPRSEETFRLVATNAIGRSTTRELTVTVAPLEVLMAQASPDTLTQGQQIRLTWTTRMADQVTIDVGTKGYLLEETEAPYLDLPELDGSPLPMTDACGTIATAGCAELVFPAGFEFPFGGITYSRVWVYTVGYVGFTTGARADSIALNQTFPTEAQHAGISLAPFWDQLRWDVERYPSGNVYAGLVEEDGEQVLVIQWKDIGQTFQNWRTASFNFEVVLRRDGTFDFRYGPQLAKGTGIPFTVLAGESATIGWQLPDQTDSGVLGFNGNLPMNGPPAHRTFSYSPKAALPLSGELVFSPFGPQTASSITVTATRDGRSHSKVVNLQIAQKPTLELEPEEIPPHPMGEEFLLGWRASNANTLVVLDEADAVRCTVTTPAAIAEGFCMLSEEVPGTYSYTVRVTGANDAVAEQVIAVDVFGAFGVASLSAAADSIEKGGDVHLRWEAFGGSSIRIYGNDVELFHGPGGQGSGSFVATGIEEATEFRLVVENDVGATDEASVSVGLWDFVIGLQASTASVRPNDPVTITVDARRLDDGTPVKVSGLLPMSVVPEPADRYSDISGLEGTVDHNINQSQTSIVIPIQLPAGFAFPYMGVEYTQLSAFADGYVSFTPGATTTSSNQPLPIPPGAFGAVVHLAPFWDDLHPRGVGRIHSGLVDEDTFVIQWSKFSTVGGTTNAAPQDLNFQVALHRSGTFDYRYGTMAPHPTHRPTSGCFPNDCTNEVNASAATVGYQFNDGTAGHSFHFGGTTPNIANLPVPGGLGGRTLRYQTIVGGGTFTFYPQKTETFSFCVESAGGPLCKDLRIEADFGLQTATVSKELITHGEPITLTWESVGGKTLNVLANGEVIHSTTTAAEIDQGSLVLNPTQNTVYVVELLAGSRSDRRQQVVEVERFGVTTTATASAGPGAPVTLSWNINRNDAGAAIQVVAPMEEISNSDWSTYDLSQDPGATVVIGANVDNQNVTLSFDDFTFPYFGTEHTSIRVATDGYLHWETSSTSTPGNQRIPNVSGSNPGKALAPFWDDLHTRQTGRVLAKKIGADRYVIQWSRVSLRWGSENTNEGDLSFMVILHRDGSFEFRYHFMDPPPNPATAASHCQPLSCERESNGSSATIGYQIPGGRAGHLIHFGGTNRALDQPTVPGGLAHRAWKFTPRSGTGAGSVQVNPADSTHYKICALDTSTDDLVCAPVVAIDVPWGIDLFQVTPQAPMAGESVTVSWSVRGVDGLQILADGVPLATHQAPSIPLLGTLPHTPTGTTTYTIRASSLDRTVTEEQLVAIRGFDLTVTGPSQSVRPGDVVEVQWQLDQHQPGAVAMVSPMSELEVGPGQTNAFLDVSALPGATQLGATGDSGAAEVVLPFPFPYLGTQQNNMRVFVDGYISFTATQGGGISENVPFPTSVWRTHEVHLAPFWDDLIARAGDTIWSYAPDASTLIIQWKQLSIAPTSTASARYDLNFQVVLRADGSFEYRYGTMTPPPAPYSHPECGPTSCEDEANGSGATIGYQSLDGLRGSTLHIGSIAPGHTPFDWGDPDGPRADSFFPFAGGLSHRSFRYTPATSGSARIVVGRTSEHEVCGFLGDFGSCKSVRIDVVEPGDVMITEVMVDPSAGASAQWIEVRNLTNETIDLEGFELASSQGSHRIGTSLPLGPRAFATLAASTHVDFTPDYVYGGDVPLTRLIDRLELRAGNAVINAVSWGTDWSVPRNQALSLDPAFHLGGVQENGERAAWCAAGAGGTPGSLGDGCVNPWYQVDPPSDRPFVDISITGTRFHDIEGFGLVGRLPDTGFKVKLFGQEHSRIWVGSNGMLSLIDTAPLSTFGIIEPPPYLPLLTSLNLGPHIGVFWTILDCSGSCRFYYERRQIEGEDVLILQWDRYRVAPAAHPPSTPAEHQAHITFQLQLWEDGAVVVAFDEIDHPHRIGSPTWAAFQGRDAWVGLESAAKTDFVSGHFRRLLDFERRSLLFQPR